MQRYGELAYLISCYTRISQPETENGMNYKTLALYWTFLSIEMENSTVKIIESLVDDTMELFSTLDRSLSNMVKMSQSERHSLAKAASSNSLPVVQELIALQSACRPR
ncbi:hypothetical protein T11_17944 [Trichinella zimbabwensis]|uniref:Uncharacterized protein n=1 Tax=Trichinella zimbabwensis TaxID=268475 RepID=A0A0V1GSU3_9BILA|nr:hypothetical protein T11_17944 [Trichinella zimbabwensis]